MEQKKSKAAIVDKIKRYISLSTLSFTLVSCIIYLIAAVAIEEGSDAVFILTPGTAFVLLLMSFVLGFSFAIFDVEKLPRTAKRLIHITITFALTVCGVLLLYTEGAGNKAMLVFLSCFVFLIIYFVCMFISAGIRKFENFIKDEKN